MGRSDPRRASEPARSFLRAFGLPLETALVMVLRAYQLAVSPMLPARCKFHPSCSAYGVDALRTHGPAKGLLLSVARVCRCHPWQLGGINPVPPKGSWRAIVDLDGNKRASAGSSVGADDLVGV